MNMKMAWLSWLRCVLNYLATGKIERAANYLACSLEYPECENDAIGQHRMFTHVTVVANSATLWPLMEDSLVPEFLPEVKSRLQRYGWSI